MTDFENPDQGLIGYVDRIERLPADEYVLKRPIPILIKEETDQVWIARFVEANLAMSGDSFQEAKESLAYSILDALETFLEEEKRLAPKLKQYLQVLKKYIEV